jgi:hypothetical protein
MSRKRRRARGGTAPPTPNALTSSAQVYVNDDALSKNLVIQPNEPQKEAWQFYRALGEVQFAVGVWLAGCVSRCRLIAAEVQPGANEPLPLDEGPAAELVASIAGGLGGQTAMLKKMAVQLSVPGESFLVGEDPGATGDPEQFKWCVYSSSELKVKRRNPLTYAVMEDEGHWRDLKGEYLVCRVWSPDDEFAWKASSPVMSSLSVMREVDYWNRYIVAILLSRLAMNGMLIIPNEVILPVDERFKDQPDPFLAKLVDVGSKAIKNPGTAAAALPIPLRIPAQFVEQVKHLTFATPVEEKVQEHRQAAINRLATSLNMPAEVLTGMGDVNHWGQWQLEESAIKIHISPILEIICHGLTQGALETMARSAGVNLVGPNGGRVIVWYDPAELTQQPDKSKEALSIFGVGGMTTEALLRESGFDEGDIPEDEELKRIVLTRIALAAGADAMRALAILTGDDSLLPVPIEAPAASGEAVSSSESTDQGQPGTEPTSDSGAAEQGPPNNRQAKATIQSRGNWCPTCASTDEPRVVARAAGVGDVMCKDEWHRVDVTRNGGVLVLNVPVNGGPGLLGDVARERHVT